MAEILPVSIGQLSESTVLDRLETNKAIINSVSDAVEVDYGFIHDVVLRLQSILGESHAQAMRNVSDIVNPATAGQVSSGDQEVVNATAASFGLTRFSAIAATGLVKFEFTTNRTVVIPSGLVMSTTGGDSIIVRNTYVGHPVGNELRGVFDRQLQPNGDGLYEIVIPASTVATGSLIRIASGIDLSLQADAVPYLSQVTTASTFTGGQDEETDAQILSRIRSSFPAASLSTRHGVSSFLRQPDLLPTISATSTIGFGDSELRRGDGLVAAADIYVRTQPLPQQKTVILTATVSGDTPGVEATWTANISRDDAPGFYRVVSAAFDNGATVKEITMVRGYDLTDIREELIPVISTAEDAAFSRFQTAVVTLVTSNASYSLGDTDQLTVVLEYMPSIDTLQTAASRREFRFVGGDSLVKAPIPVFTSVAIDIVADVDVISVDIPSIQSSVASLFASEGFCTTIYSSEIAELVNSQLPSGAAVRVITGLGQVIYPDGTIKKQRYQMHFEFENDRTAGVTARNAAWYLSANDVSINVSNNAKPIVI